LSFSVNAQLTLKTHSKSPPTKSRTKGEILADKINFDRATWDMTSAGDLAPGFLSIKEQREEFISNINSGAELEFCNKCKEKHIPPGSPITLQDRDTCGSYLPEVCTISRKAPFSQTMLTIFKWFPADKVLKPWDYFTALLNEKVKLDEISQDYNHRPNPDKKQWDLEFHDDQHPRWDTRWKKQFGRSGGWWKCRNINTPDASAVERECDLCHRPNPKSKQKDPKADEDDETVEEKQKKIEVWVDRQIKLVGEKDKAIVLAQWQAEAMARMESRLQSQERNDFRSFRNTESSGLR